MLAARFSRDIAVEGVRFQSAGHAERSCQRIRDHSNDLGPATQDQIGFSSVSRRLAGYEQLTLDPLMGQDGLGGDAVEAVAAQIFGLGFYSGGMFRPKETQNSWPRCRSSCRRSSTESATC